MIRAPRPKPQYAPSANPALWLSLRLVLLASAALAPAAAWAQSPLASSYATRDGRAPTTVLGCVAVDGSYTAQPCGVIGYPLHVTIDSGLTSGTSVPTTASGTASSQLVGVQGGGSGALPVSVVDSTVAQVVAPSQLTAAALGTPNDAPASSTGSVVAQLRRIANLLAAAPNGAVNADGGQQVHVMNLPATQPVSAASLPLPSGAAQDGTDATGITPPSGAAGIRGWLSGIYSALAGNLKVVVQPGGATVPVSAAALPLPSGAATAAAQPALNGDGGALAHVTNFPSTQPVSAAALPLPSGAATAALQAALNASQPALNGDGGALAHVTNFPATQPVSAASLPLPAGAATASLQPALNGDGGSQVHVQNFPATQAVSAASLPLPSGAAQDGADATGATQPSGGTGIRGWLSGIYTALSGNLKVVVQSGGATMPVSAASLPLPSGAATASLQPALNGDGGSQVHVQNFPASQAVTNAGSFAVQDSAVIAGVSTVASNTALRSGAWTDASFTASGTASTPSNLGAVASRTGLHVWNNGTVTVCMNYTATAAASGSGCAAGSVPIPAGSAYLEDQPGNVSPEAISLVCAGTSCPLTIKVR